MSAWLARNAAPIGLVIVASAAVIASFEFIDFVADSAPAAAKPGGELTGIASLGGLVKVALFFGVGSLVARPLRHRFNEDKKSRRSRA